MIDLLARNPLLLLFVVAAIGYLLGRIKLGGVSLGVAAVLFVGLGFGALSPELKTPEVLQTLGLVLFIYTIGLSGGPGFFAALRSKGLRDNLLVAGIIAAATGAAIGAGLLLGLPGPVVAGVLAGSMTNTPALAAVIDQLRRGGISDDLLLAEPVVGYSVTYPMGVLGTILAIYVLQRLWRTDYAAEARGLRGLGAGGEQLVSRTVRVTSPELGGRSVADLIASTGWDVVFGRIQRGGELSLATGDARLQPGDLVSVVGDAEEVQRVMAALGEPAAEPLELDRHTLDFRRIFVSNPAVVGRRLRDLDLPRRYGAIVTRIRRGDVDILPHADTSLELGDRVRVVTRRENLEALGRFFGDSYRSLSEVDVVSLGLGIALGLLLGLLPIPLPGGGSFSLGLAGGPLIVALILGWRERTGPIVWSLPYSANLTLRQFGLILFLAGVGTRSGYSFVTTLAQGGGLPIFLLGVLITALATLTLLVAGHRLLGIPMSLLTGMVAGMQTQPAVLGFASEQSGNDLPNLGYATVYPVATIGKIIAVQLVVMVLG